MENGIDRNLSMPKSVDGIDSKLSMPSGIDRKLSIRKGMPTRGVTHNMIKHLRLCFLIILSINFNYELAFVEMISKKFPPAAGNIQKTGLEKRV